MNIRQQIKNACENGGVTLREIAQTMGITASTLTNRLKTGKFTKQELAKMAERIGCEYYSYFEFSDGVIISSEDIGDQIREALTYAKMNTINLSDKLGMSKQGISSRLKVGKFTQEDLSVIAGHIGCKYVSGFRFDRYETRKCIYIRFNKFVELIRSLFGYDIFVSYTYDGLLFIDITKEEGDKTVDNRIIEALSEHYGVNVISIHTDNEADVGVWICYE